MLKQGDRFNNKNGELCQVTAVATDLRDGSTRVVYQKMCGDFGFFISDIDEKGEAAVPENRAASLKKQDTAFAPTGDTETREIFEGEVNPDLLAFLEADSVDEKLEVLESIKSTEDEKLLSAIEASLDIITAGGSPEDRVAYIRQTLKTRAKFEGGRLRG